MFEKNEILLEEFLLDLFLYGFIFPVLIKQDARGPDHPVYTAKIHAFVRIPGSRMDGTASSELNSCPLGQGQMAKIERFVAFRCFPATLLASIRLIEISTTRRRSLNRSLFVEPSRAFGVS